MTFKLLLEIIRKFINRNKFNYLASRKIKSGQVNLHWYRLSEKVQNVGDFLSPFVVDYMKKQKSVCDNTASKGTQHLLAIGSVIDSSYQNSVVWGSGLIRENRKYWWRFVRKLDVRAVRGPETRRVLIENGYSCPEVYGDPAILMPLIYMPEKTEKEYDYKIIYNYGYVYSKENVLLPLVYDWKSFIDEIVKCKLVISSSLHGIILAEAYGIPAIMLKSPLNTFKFRDYYYSTERYDFPVANTIEEALTMEPPPLPNLDKLRQGLIDSFPYDIWKN